jgi:DNA polymerase-3 subunit delta'
LAGAFEQIIGNSGALALLRATLAGGRPAHAYLFTGPARIGKRTMARWLAAALTCLTGGPAVPCGACRACRLVARDAHPDVRLVEPEAGRRGVTIDQVRQLEHAASLRPYEAARKVFIVRGVDAMQDAAANALLKTLEEPPDDTVLALTATDVSQVLPTIASRCREVALRPVPAEEIEAALIARGVAAAEAMRLACLAAGRPGWALAASADEKIAAAHERHVDALERLLRTPQVQRLAVAADYGDAAAVQTALDVWLGWWRDALLAQQGCPDLIANVDRTGPLTQAGSALTPEAIWRALARIQETRQQLDANANVRLALESLFLDLPELGKPAPT